MTQISERAAAITKRASSLNMIQIREMVQNYGALIALVMLIFFAKLFTHQFDSVIAVTNLLVYVAPNMMLSIGMTLVIATGGIDISVGSVMGITGVLAYQIFSGKLLGIHNIVLGTMVAIPVALTIATLIGACNGFMITRLNIQPIVATLITLITARGVGEVIQDGFQFAFLSAPIVGWLSGNVLGFLPKQIITMTVVIGVFSWIMYATTFSRNLLAVGGNRSAARLAGLPVNRILVMVYAISGFLAGLAGLTFIAFVGAANPVRDGLGIELDAIAAVAVGGTPLTGGRANIIGTVIGVIFIQLLRNTLVSLNIKAEIASMVIGVLIILAVYIQRQRSA